MTWQVYVLALVLVMVAEAFLPAVAPQLWLRLVRQLTQLNAAVLQRLALMVLVSGMIIFGAVSVYG